jgi:hypothetical protein
MKPRFKLGSVNETVLVGIDQPAHAPLDLLGQGFQRLQAIVPGGLGQAAFVLVGDPRRLLQQGTDVLPDGLFQ